MQLKRIVILGPESTGKSTLCAQLAAHFKSSWVPEYARTYLQDTNNTYEYEDLWEIAKGQQLGEENAEKNYYKMHASAENRPGYPLFVDTDLYVLKIWSEISFNKCDNRILSSIAQTKQNLYLLCNTDLPWVEDPLREYPDLDMRQKIYQFYLDAMINQHVPWVDINGGYKERLEKAIESVDALLKK